MSVAHYEMRLILHRRDAETLRLRRKHMEDFLCVGFAPLRLRGDKDQPLSDIPSSCKTANSV